MTARLSADERDLLREWVHIIAPVIANPSEECRRPRESRRSGGGFGRNYEVTGQRFTGTWAHYEVTGRFTTGPQAGEPSRLRFDPPHREVSITLARLGRWADALPAELRERAQHAWATRTRNQTALTAIALEAIDLHAQAELEAARAEWFTTLPCTQPPALSPACAKNTHVGCWHGRERPPGYVGCAPRRCTSPTRPTRIRRHVPARVVASDRQHLGPHRRPRRPLHLRMRLPHRRIRRTTARPLRIDVIFGRVVIDV